MTAREDAARVIRAVLADGPHSAGQVEQATADAGISVRTARRAAEEIGVVRTRDGVHTWWALPTPEATRAGSAGTAARPGPAPAGRETSPAPAGATHATPGTRPGRNHEEIETMTDEMTDDPGARYVEAVRDGLTVGRRVLAVGDVVELPVPGTDAHAATQGRDGASWADDLTDAGQIARWGEVHLRPCGAPVAATPTADDPAPRVPVEPIRPTALPDARGAFPAARGEVEWTRPLVAGLGGDGPVQIVADRARG